MLVLLGEPNALWRTWLNPFFALTAWTYAIRVFRNRVWTRLMSFIAKKDSPAHEGPEEDIHPQQLQELCSRAGLDVVRLGTYDYLPRSGHWWHLAGYRWLRRVESGVLSKWFPFGGGTIVCYGIKR